MSINVSFKIVQMHHKQIHQYIYEDIILVAKQQQSLCNCGRISRYPAVRCSLYKTEMHDITTNSTEF
jgi:CDGSH-type Zn-finger protein